MPSPGGGRVVSLPVRSIDGQAPRLSLARRQSQSPSNARMSGGPSPTTSVRLQFHSSAADEPGRPMRLGDGPGGTHRLAAHRTVSDVGSSGAAPRWVSAAPRLAEHRTLSEPGVSEGTPPSLQKVGLEHTLRVNANETAVQTLQSRTNLLTEDLRGMADAFASLTATVNDSSEGLNVLLDVMDTTATHKDLEALEQRLQSSFEATLRAKLKPIEDSARADAAELVALRELVGRDSAAVVERLEKVETRMAGIESQLLATEELVSKLEAQTKRSADMVGECREATDRSEERFAAVLEAELQSFARSFGKAVTSMNAVVQSVDHKAQMSINTLAQSIESSNVNNVLQISQLADYVSKSLDAARKRAEDSEAAMERLAGSVGRAQKDFQAVVSGAQEEASKASESASCLPLLQSELATLSDGLEAASQHDAASDAALAEIRAALTELTGRVREQNDAKASAEKQSYEVRMDTLESTIEGLETRMASIQAPPSHSPAPRVAGGETLQASHTPEPQPQLEAESSGTAANGSSAVSHPERVAADRPAEQNASRLSDADGSSTDSETEEQPTSSTAPAAAAAMAPEAGNADQAAGV